MLAAGLVVFIHSRLALLFFDFVCIVVFTESVLRHTDIGTRSNAMWYCSPFHLGVHFGLVLVSYPSLPPCSTASGIHVRPFFEISHRCVGIRLPSSMTPVTQFQKMSSRFLSMLSRGHNFSPYPGVFRSPSYKTANRGGFSPAGLVLES